MAMENTTNSSDSRIEELSDSELPTSEMEQVAMSAEEVSIPSLFTSHPPIKDNLVTITSEMQGETLAELLPYLMEPEGDLNVFGISSLIRKKHTRYLRHMLEGPFPPQFVAADATRPWMLYWALAAMTMLDVDVSEYRERIISTCTPFQNKTGGFGGGHGQFSHIATSYASVLSIVMVGGQEALDLIDRKAMWHWLGQMKQKNGGFSVCEGGEIDIRGAYCSMTIISLLNLPLELPANSPAQVNGDETFLTNLEEWVSSCQTYEGGIAGAPNNEAHGAYAFCALACLAIIDTPSKIIPRCLNMPSLISWLSSQQHAPDSGFAGRTNKLVDGCYSHWVGGCWPIISAALSSSSQPQTDLWSREGLIRFILCCCQQQKQGGLRDKPSKNPDSYHSCYVLAGLSTAQHYFGFQDQESFSVVRASAGFGWSITGRADVICDEDDWVKPVHPLFVVPFERAVECRKYFEEREGF
ncbi:prenyltransferase [Tothia fuscella]|uniref:Protein farnesyltransferase subunit beta n=1 Tax=Tothia fuscella TaxID=1048955 RepID=A0A9P4NXZ5_9PEZI|nr:prenyltransferase [Tothia fuscella]